MLGCKPSDKKQWIEGREGIYLRSLQPKKDSVLLATKDSREEWIQVYQNIIASTDAHAWVAMHLEEPIGQLDVYLIKAGELGNYFEARSNDAVVQYRHLQKHGAHKEILLVFMQYYFAHRDAGLLYAQANIYDDSACRLYESVGCIFQQNLMLSSQAVSLYLMTPAKCREQLKQ